ncbi:MULTISPECIES: hypothetical protein [unclassified Streptomyces]|uniref:hypothetical protein n=1 Tax=unclassified Streptomyces TaxID=2593676 RepID=UPI000939FDDD|nr:hypothetical protein [Streptomyces sp. TSRI0281]OKI35032.1 hypothetical protein A6A29_16555 [Streptomyces sp. TSRI0281]
MIVTGVAAVLDQPMRNRPVTFTRPRPYLTAPGAPVIRDGKQVGEVLRAWVDGHLVHWEGLLMRPVLGWTDTPGDDALIPECEPPLPDLVAGGRLVGLTDLVRAQMTYQSTGTIVSNWSIAGVTLLPYGTRPWLDLYLAPAP